MQLQKDVAEKNKGGIARENCEATRSLEAVEEAVSQLFFPTVLGLMNFVWGTFHGEINTQLSATNQGIPAHSCDARSLAGYMLLSGALLQALVIQLVVELTPTVRLVTAVILVEGCV